MVPPSFIKLDVEGSEVSVLLGLIADGLPEELRGLIFEASTMEAVDRISRMLGPDFEVTTIRPTANQAPTNFLALRHR